MKNFELTNETVVSDFGITLHRIRAIKDIVTPHFTIKSGEFGGFVEKVDNLADNAWVSGNAMVYGDAIVSGNARVYGDAMVSGDAIVSDNARVFDNAWVYGDAIVSDNAMVYGNARVSGDARVSGNARVYDNARVFRTNHYLVIGPIGSRNDYTTFFRSKEGVIKVKCGYFVGTTDEFIDKVEKTHNDSKYAKVYRMATEMALAQIDMN
jgi:carbonic anhydrase/acetyltransferase-like protein (isoleucine patch superfamily)